VIDNKNTKPQLTEDKIQDIYVRKNFKNLNDYFSTQNQLYDFKFFDIEFFRASDNQKVEHGLGYVPQDVIVTKITGDGIVSFNHGLFDSKYINLSSTGAARIRFFVGSYWQSTNKKNDVKSAVTEYSSKVSGSSSSISSSSIKSSNPVKVFTSGSWSYVASEGVKYIKITVTGGGGAGGNSTAGNAASGGGAGGTAIKFLYELTAGQALNVVVGAAGVASSVSGPGFSTITANPGTAGTTGVGANGTAGGAGGTATNGDINIQGGDGDSNCGVVAGTVFLAGNGGSSFWGGGGYAGGTGVGIGAAGKAYGSGGGGGANGGSGGAGKEGVAVIEEYY
jgi:hypothetical protein